MTAYGHAGGTPPLELIFLKSPQTWSRAVMSSCPRGNDTVSLRRHGPFSSGWQAKKIRSNAMPPVMARMRRRNYQKLFGTTLTDERCNKVWGSTSFLLFA